MCWGQGDEAQAQGVDSHSPGLDWCLGVQLAAKQPTGPAGLEAQGLEDL